MKPPKPKKDIKIESIIDICNSYFEWYKTSFHEDGVSDQIHYVYEGLMEEIYGDGNEVWDYINHYYEVG